MYLSHQVVDAPNYAQASTIAPYLLLLFSILSCSIWSTVSSRLLIAFLVFPFLYCLPPFLPSSNMTCGIFEAEINKYIFNATNDILFQTRVVYYFFLGTPGRLVDHLENTKGFSLRSLKFLVSSLLF